MPPPPSLKLKAVDRIEVQVLVDNVTDNLSTLPAGITHEWAYLIREGLVTEISGDNTCCACHGLALAITVKTGGRRAHGCCSTEAPPATPSGATASGSPPTSAASTPSSCLTVTGTTPADS